MSDPDTPEYKALFAENEKKINQKMQGLFYEERPESNNWSQLTVQNLKDSVTAMNEEYLRKVLLGTDTKEEKEYLAKLEAELARKIIQEQKESEPKVVTSLFGD